MLMRMHEESSLLKVSSELVGACIVRTTGATKRWKRWQRFLPISARVRMGFYARAHACKLWDTVAQRESNSHSPPTARLHVPCPRGSED